MIVLGYDLESTGLDTSTARIIEVGAALYDMNEKMPLQLLSCFIRPDWEMPPDYVSPTGIKGEWLLKFGIPLREAFTRLEELAAHAECVTAQNGENYDKPLTVAELRRLGVVAPHIMESLHWVDTRYDLPFDYAPKSRHLNHLAADAGFINPFPHRALFDAMTCLRLAAQHDFEKVLAHSKIPWVNVRIMTNFDQRQIAKDLRYSPHYDDKGKFQFWSKKVKEDQFEAEKMAAEARGVSVVKLA